MVRVHYRLRVTPAPKRDKPFAFDIDMSRTVGYSGVVNYATAAGTPEGATILPFSTNDDLLAKLQAHAGRVDAIFHAAALCDYRVKSIHAEHGDDLCGAAKIPTRSGALTLELEPTVKVLPQLRALFPQAKIIGWKYELDGTGDDVIDRALRQLAECSSNACVVNGAAWGDGFGFTPNRAGRRPDIGVARVLGLPWDAANMRGTNVVDDDHKKQSVFRVWTKGPYYQKPTGML